MDRLETPRGLQRGPLIPIHGPGFEREANVQSPKVGNRPIASCTSQWITNMDRIALVRLMFVTALNAN